MQFDENEMTMRQKSRLLNRRGFLLATLASGLVLGGQSEGSDLIVDVKYTGSGTVDASHKVYVVLWDSHDVPRDGSHVLPLAIKPVSEKSGSVRFSGIKSNPVYLSAVYDPTGQWDAKSAPPQGASLGLYAKKKHTPEPIQLSAGKAVTISLTFPDAPKATI